MSSAYKLETIDPNDEDWERQLEGIIEKKI